MIAAVAALVMIPVPASCPPVLPEKIEAVIAGTLSKMNPQTKTNKMSIGNCFTIVPGSVKPLMIA